MFPDVREYEPRLRVLQGLPWPIPARVLMRFTDEDLDCLAVAGEAGRDEYWRALNAIVARVSICQRPQRFHKSE
jgi:hypothetical protein